jgi:hypothetical protein
MKHPQKQHRLFLRMQVISEPGVPSNVPPGIFGSIAHAGDVHHAMHHSSRESPKSGGAEGVKGATADFVRFHCPLVAPEGAIPLLLEKAAPIDGFLICMKAK